MTFSFSLDQLLATIADIAPNRFLQALMIIVVTALAVYFVFLAWQIDVTAWMASAGILGLAVSFAAKDTLANLFSGVFIVADAPYKLGDFIVLDSGERGEVTHIGIRSTRLLTRDDVEVTVPNSIMGNAFGSNVANVGLILGTTALISPIAVQSRILRKELPLLTAVTLLTVWLLSDNRLTRVEAVSMLILFVGVLAWSVRQGMRHAPDILAEATAQELPAQPPLLGRAIFWLLLGLAMLLASSRVLVWGAVEIACRLGVSDLIIGLTIVALGTSLPELASSIVAALKGEHDIALGNVIGSNLFNTLAVVGIAGAIQPFVIGPEVFSRDIPVMALLTVSLFVFGYGFKGPGRINRLKGGMLMLGYVGYMGYLAGAVVGP